MPLVYANPSRCGSVAIVATILFAVGLPMSDKAAQNHVLQWDGDGDVELPAGIADPDWSRTYQVIAVDSSDQQLGRSNRVGEYEFTLP